MAPRRPEGGAPRLVRHSLCASATHFRMKLEVPIAGVRAKDAKMKEQPNRCTANRGIAVVRDPRGNLFHNRRRAGRLAAGCQNFRVGTSHCRERRQTLDSEILSTQTEAIFDRLSEEARFRIEAVRAEAVAKLLADLSQFWESIPLSLGALQQHNPAELVPCLLRYAEAQFEIYAAELLPYFSEIDRYVWCLATDVIDRISAAIRPPQAFIPEQLLSGDWRDLIRLLRDSQAELAENVEKLVESGGEWEMYVERSFRRQLMTRRLLQPTWDEPKAASAITRLNMVFQVKYKFYLRLFRNFFDFDIAIRAHLSDRLPYWEAQAHRYAVTRAMELSPKQGLSERPMDRPDLAIAPDSIVALKKKRGRPILISVALKERALEAQRQGAKAKQIAQIAYDTPHPTRRQMSDVGNILANYERSKNS